MKSVSDYSLAKAILDGVDETIAASERRWGVDRLRLLVADDLRARWDRQWVAYCRAVKANDLADIQKHGAAVRRAVAALEAAATAAGAEPISPVVWEATYEGRVIAVVRTSAEAYAVATQGRGVEVWTLDELVRVALPRTAMIAAVKEVFPGAEVTAYKSPPTDWASGGDPLPDFLIA
jgi:hypothetical protein